MSKTSVEERKETEALSIQLLVDVIKTEKKNEYAERILNDEAMRAEFSNSFVQGCRSFVM
jgi:hypothetical protein